MKKSHIIIASVAFVMIVFISAKSFENEKTEYEYLNIHFSSTATGRIYISSLTEGYQIIKVPPTGETYSMSPLLQLIESYENSGYELFEFNTYGKGTNNEIIANVLMRKSK